MFETLGERIQTAIRDLKGAGRISDINIASALKDIRRALVAADVNYRIAKDVTDGIKNKAMGERIKLSVSPGQYFTKLTADALTELMGSAESALSLKQRPSRILVAGLQGSGKTTFCAKLSLKLKKQGLKTALVACDLHRPAAIEQLKTLGERIDVAVYADTESKDTLAVGQAGVAAAQAEGASVIIIDTAGRLGIDQALMEELSALKKALQPEETLFVADAMMGQDAVTTAHAFAEKIHYEGIVLTKLDGDTRGGAALSIRATTKRPIKFVSMGEDLDSLEVFHPDRMAQRILGMGDVVSLVERAQEQFEQEEAQRITRKLKKNTFDLDDFLDQLQRVRKMGKLKDLAAMIPGMGKRLHMLEDNEDALLRPEAIIRSMTPMERKNPDIIKQSRKLRIARGSGSELTEVNALLKRYDMMRKMMRKAGKGNLQALQQMFANRSNPS